MYFDYWKKSLKSYYFIFYHFIKMLSINSNFHIKNNKLYEYCLKTNKEMTNKLIEKHTLERNKINSLINTHKSTDGINKYYLNTYSCMTFIIFGLLFHITFSK